MTNESIIKAIKDNDLNGIKNLAEKYDVTNEQAERIAESIREHNAYAIRKVRDKYDEDWTNIFVSWRGYGYLGSFKTSTRFTINDTTGKMLVYGDC